MLTLTRNVGDRILSVKDRVHEMDDVELLQELLDRFSALKEETGIPQKALAHAVGVSESRIGEWREMVAGKGDRTLNNATRNEIRSILAGEAQARSEGMEWTLDQLRATASDVEAALLVRHRLSTPLTEEGEARKDREALEEASAAAPTPDQADEPKDRQVRGGGRDG